MSAKDRGIGKYRKMLKKFKTSVALQFLATAATAATVAGQPGCSCAVGRKELRQLKRGVVFSSTVRLSECKNVDLQSAELIKKIYFRPRLPDDLFLDQKSQFGYILEGLGMENVIWYDL
jgi:hypothetical protein